MGLVFGVLALAVGLSGARQLMETAAHSPRLPLWDMAKYGAGGLRLHDALADGQLWQAIVEINDMSVWPPWWPSVSAVAFAVLGPGFSTPRILLTLLWALAVAVAAWAPRPLQGGAPAGALAAAWLAAGPMFQSLAVVNLLELPGLLLLMLALGCYLRALSASTPRAEHRWWWATAVASLCLFFCKYNYGLLWLLPLAASEAYRRCGSWGAFGGRVLVLIPRLPWRRPLWWLLLVWLALLLAIRWSGGFELTLGGREVRATSIGNPAYALYLALCGWAAYRYRTGSGYGDFLPPLTPTDRILGRWLVLPIALWMLIPPHVKDLFGFLENRSSDLPWFEGLVFYPRAVIESYAAHEALGLVVIAVAVLGIRDLWSESDGRRVVALNLWLGVLALLTHPYKLERFGFQTAWLLGLVAGLTLTRSLGPSAGKGYRLFVSGAALAALVVAGRYGIDRPFVEQHHRLWTVSEQVHPMLDEFADVEKRRDGGVLVLGTWNGLSPALIEWNARRIDSLGQSEKRAPLPSTGFEQARRRADRLGRVVEQGRYRWIAVVSAEPGTAFDQETAWMQPVLQNLSESRAYELQGPIQAAGSYSWRWFKKLDPS